MLVTKLSFYGHGEEFLLLEDALEAGGIAWWLMELPSKAVFFGINKIVMMGYSKREADQFKRYTDFTDRVHPDDYDQAMEAMKNLLTGVTDTYETQYRIKAKDGNYITFYDRGKIVGRKGDEIAIAGIVMDVSRQSPASVGEAKYA